MSNALTVKAIENFKPGASRREVPDGDVRGLYLQIFPSGKASWAFRYRFGGRTRKLTIGASPEIGLKDARDLARAAHLQIASGEDPGAVKQAARTDAKALPARDIVEKVAAQFLARHVKNLAAATRIEVGRIVAKEILPTFRGRRLSEIKRPDVIEWLDGIVDRPAPIAANRALGWLKGLCNFAVERGVLDVSPIAGIKPPAAETARDRVLSDDELKAVWEAADALETSDLDRPAVARSFGNGMEGNRPRGQALDASGGAREEFDRALNSPFGSDYRDPEGSPADCRQRFSVHDKRQESYPRHSPS
jgi:hypothetical protein